MANRQRANETEALEPRRRERTLALLLGLAGAVFFALQYRPALRGWFYREDARYFSNGLFSLYDVLAAFLTSQNSMGHYRPITKLIWGVPEWLGYADAHLYHAFLALSLAAAAVLLMRLSFLLFGNALLAVLAGILWALMPVNARPLYWICAGQDTTAALFVIAALVFRLEQWNRPDQARLFRVLCLTSVFFALSSREAGFAGTLLLFLVDWRYGKLRKSGDVAALWLPFFVFVYVLSPPFARAHVKLDPWHLFSIEALQESWAYAQATFWVLGDAIQLEYPPLASVLTVLVIAAGLVAPFFDWSFLLATLLALSGMVPYILIQHYSVEYFFLFGAGAALIVTGVPAILFRRGLARLRGQLLAVVIGFTAIDGYYWYLEGSRRIYENNYAYRSLLLKGLFDELATFSRGLPEFTLVQITDLGPYFDSEARDSHHFIPPGLDHLVSNRTFLISPNVLRNGEGTEQRDPEARYLSLIHI